MNRAADLEASYRFCRADRPHARPQFLLLLSAAFPRSARRHVRHLRLHALLRRHQRSRRRSRGRQSSAGGEDLDRALSANIRDNPLWPAFHDTVQRYQIPHQYFHEMIDGVSRRPGAAPHPDLRRALSLLLPGRERRWPDHHSHLRLRIARSAETRRKMRHRVPVDQHPARCARGSAEWPCLHTGGRHRAIRRGSLQTRRPIRGTDELRGRSAPANITINPARCSRS